MRRIWCCARLGAAVALALAWAAPARANLLAYDGFAYGAPGSLNGQNGGTGWGSAWSAPGTATMEAPGTDYNYGALVHAGNVTDVATNGTGSYRMLNTTYSTLNNVYWFSVVMDVDQNIDAAFAGMSLFLSTDSNKKEKLFIGEDTAHSDWSFELSADTGRRGSNVAIQTQHATLLVVEVDGINQQINMWVNPTSLGGADPAAGTANATESLAGNEFQFDEIRLEAGGSETMDADEIRMGTSYADVTPSSVPEPSGPWTVGLALGLLAVLHRGRQAMAS